MGTRHNRLRFESANTQETEQSVKRSSDYLVIGSGIAGLCFALEAAKSGSVTVVTKKRDSESNTNHAQGGIACVLSSKDSFDCHYEDTLRTGQGLCSEEAVRILVEEGPRRIRQLLAWGVEFTTSQTSRAYHHLHLGREGGHSVNRIAHARDLTGREVEERLLAQAKRHRNITIHENHCLVELITNHHMSRRSREVTCFGAYVFDAVNRRTIPLRAGVTLLSTGGAGQVYLHTTNPAIATGDGVACAFRAGAEIANMEFIQFHPTSLYHPNADSFLISEAARGYGGVLRDSLGREFMAKYHPMKSLAPRDVVARAIDSELKATGESCVYLDIRHKQRAATRRHFPNIYSRCLEHGIDITSDLIPVVPAAHYLCGGVRVDINGVTSIRRLYACGESACTGVHGANRLASNSLLEALVFSRRAALHAAGALRNVTVVPAREVPQWDDSGTMDNEEWVLLSHNLLELKSLMWDYVGIVRSTHRLKRAARRIRLLEHETDIFYRRTKITPDLLELRNIITVAKLIVLSALRRRESRGLHFTTDFPTASDRFWRRDTILTETARRSQR